MKNGIENFIAPDETVHFRSPDMVDYQGNWYYFFITDRRLIWHATVGLIFKKNELVWEAFDKIKGVRYREEGILFKKAFIDVDMGTRTLSFTGKLPTIQAINTEIQTLLPNIARTN